MLRTEGRRLRLVHEILTRDIERLHQALASGGRRDSILLVGRRQLRNMNSWLHNARPLAVGRERCTLRVHPADAERLGLEHGKSAIVRSRVGAVTAPIEVSDEMMPGVVSLPHGFGHGAPGTRLAVANSAQPGVNSNQLCDELAIDVPSGTSVANGIPVEISPA